MVQAQRTYYSRATGNWASSSTWSTSAYNSSTNTGTFPGSSDNVFIGNGFTVTIAANASCATLQVGANAATGASNVTTTLTLGSFNLTVSGLTTVGGNGNAGRTGTINWASSSTATLTTGSLQLGNSATTPASGTIDMTNGGTLSVGTGMTVGTASGTWTPGAGTVTKTGSSTLPSSIFNTFNNLTINGGTTALGVVAGTTINGNLTITSGTLNTGSNLPLTLNGNFTNSGTFTAGSSAINFGGTATQNIAGFTTTGTVSMLKTGGTATLQGAVNGGNLVINGSSGSLNLGGPSFTHTFSGTWSMQAGTLNGGNASLLQIAGNANVNTGGTFTASSGSVIYNGADQTILSLPYNYLTFSGSGNKTVSSGFTVTAQMKIIDPAKANLNSGVNILANGGSNSLLFSGVYPATEGTWGSSSSAAAHQNDTYFAANTGIITVLNGPTTLPVPVFTITTASHQVCSSATTTTLAGTLIAPGPTYPLQDEIVHVTINGVTQNTTINNSTGGFTINYNTTALPVSATPYTITYSYGGGFIVAAASPDATTSITMVEPTAYNVTGGGSYCAGGTGLLVGLDNSDLNVNYQLKLGAVNQGTPVAGTGTLLSFPLQTSAGTYTVVATDLGGCTKTMTGSVSVTIVPVSVGGTLSASQIICTNSCLLYTSPSPRD